MRRAVAVISVTLILLATGCRRNAAAPDGSPPAPTPAEQIAKHKWWPKPISTDEVEQVIQALIESNLGDHVLVDGAGKIRREKRGGYIDQVSPVGHKLLLGLLRIDGRALHFHVTDGEKRPDRAQVMALFVGELDHAELRDGPGR